MAQENEWFETYVVDALDRHESKLSEIDDHIVQMKESLASMKVKAGIWSAVAGAVAAIPVAISILLLALK